MRGGEEVEDGADDCQYTKNSIRQRSHAGRRVAGLCVEAPMTASTQKTQ